MIFAKRLIAVALLASAVSILLAGCTQWGTSVFRSVDVWWACPDRDARCEPERAALTYVQAWNTYAGALRDLRRAEAAGISEQRLRPLRYALEQAVVAMCRVSSPPSWDADLADFMLWSVRAERLAEKVNTPRWQRFLP